MNWIKYFNSRVMYLSVLDEPRFEFDFYRHGEETKVANLLKPSRMRSTEREEIEFTLAVRRLKQIKIKHSNTID